MGDYVTNNDEICYLHINNEEILNNIENKIKEEIILSDDKVEKEDVIIETIM